jgi:hypothetical protein
MLPIEWLNSAKQDELIIALSKHQAPISKFSEDKLKTQSIMTIPIMENFQPDEVIRVLAYIIENINDVLKWQIDILKNEPTHNDDDFVVTPHRASMEDTAAKRIVRVAIHGLS